MMNALLVNASKHLDDLPGNTEVPLSVILICSNLILFVFVWVLLIMIFCIYQGGYRRGQEGHPVTEYGGVFIEGHTV